MVDTGVRTASRAFRIGVITISHRWRPHDMPLPATAAIYFIDGGLSQLFLCLRRGDARDEMIHDS